VKIYLIIFLSFTFTQTDINFSLESKFGEGTNITNEGSTEKPYNYFENILDVNMQFSSGVSLWSQWEYSEPPIFGVNKNGLNKFYFEYSEDVFNVKVGDIYTLYGRGLSLNMVISQNVDLDNSIRGLEFEFYPSDYLRVFSLVGKGRYDYRTNPAQTISDRWVNNRVYSIGMDYDFNQLGIFQMYYLNQSSEIDESMMNLYNNEHLDTRLGKEFYDRVSYEEYRTDTLSSKIINLNWTNSIGLIDYYFEYSGNNYSKLLGDDTDGYKIYGSLSTYLAGFGITYEYKDYNEPYFIQSLGGAPIVYRESTSILGSRYNHSMNFNDEIGHQIEIQYAINENLNWMVNASQSNSHVGKYLSIDIDSLANESTQNYIHSNPFNLVFMQGNDEDLAFKPFRQFYTEFSGYTFNNHLFFQVGIDLLDDVFKYHDTKVYDYGDINIDNYIHFVDSSLSIWNIEELNLVTKNYNNNLSNFSGIWNDYFNLCESLGDYICPGQTANEYADSTIFSSYGISYEDSLANLFSNYEFNYENRENELKVESTKARSDSLKSKKYEYTEQTVVTLPMRFSWNFGDGSSISTYWEHQWRNVNASHDILLLDGTIDSRLTKIENYYNQYFSISYRHPKKWSITLFYDGETHDKKLGGEIWSDKYNDWKGADFTFDMNSSSQLSIFYGSQKGGRICANGVCADQPGFKDGFKLTYRSFF